MRPAFVLLGVVTAQRAVELVLARRNTSRLRSHGGVEHGAAHYPLVVALHAAWLGGLWLTARRRRVRSGWVRTYLVLEGLRAWVLGALGTRWTTRIITVPGEALTRRGPYRFIPHPNYAVVAGEIATLPLALGLPGYAAVFSLLDAAVLGVRIRAENRALRAR